MFQLISGPPYDSIYPRIYSIFLLYLFLFPLSFIFAHKLLKKGRIQNLKSAKFLGNAFIFYGLGVLTAFLGVFEVILTSEFKEIYRLSLPVGYSFGIIGNVYLLFFGNELFGFQRRYTYPFLIWSIITLILVNLNSNWYGVPNFVYEGQFSLRLYSSLNMTIFSLVIYTFLIIKINSLKLKDFVKSVGYKLIVWSLICFILFWGFMTVDAIMINISEEGFSIFTFIAWVFAGIFWILSYCGLIMPPKIRTILESKTHISNDKNHQIYRE